MITLNEVRKSYRTGSGSMEVLKGIDMHIEEGEMVSIMGSSGSGKSTLLNILGILDAYDSGEYLLNKTLIRNLTQTRSAQLRSQFIGFVFQSFNLVSFKNALENVALPLYYQKVKRRQRNKIAMEYLERVGLTEWAEHLPSEMSGGQKQRIAIARALITKPKVILADEPTGALDSVTTNEVMELLSQIHQGGVTMVIVTHEADVASRTQRIIRIRDGIIS